MIWFTSDLHFGHDNIIDYCNRPFNHTYVKSYGRQELILAQSRVEAMNQSLIENWNGIVAENDVVYVLGDFAMGKISETLNMVSSLNGVKLLVPGNHDRCWFGGKKDHDKWVSKYLDAGFSSILGNSVDNGCGVVNLDHLFPEVENGVDVCHFPFTGDSREDDRYTAYRPNDHGQFLLHGHVHDTWITKGKMINVGVDVWHYRPVSIDEIKKVIDYVNEYDSE